MRINILCCDLDDTITDYPGWEGEGYTIVKGTPLEGIHDAIATLRNEGWLILVHSTRCNFKGGVVATAKWLEDNGIRVDGVCFNKPPADIYLDDKGMTFDGNWAGMLDKIRKFKTWKKMREPEKPVAKSAFDKYAFMNRLAAMSALPPAFVKVAKCKKSQKKH